MRRALLGFSLCVPSRPCWEHGKNLTTASCQHLIERILPQPSKQESQGLEPHSTMLCGASLDPRAKTTYPELSLHPHKLLGLLHTCESFLLAE